MWWIGVLACATASVVAWVGYKWWQCRRRVMSALSWAGTPPPRRAKKQETKDGLPNASEVGALIADVSTRLRAGQPTAHAWVSSLRQHGYYVDPFDGPYPPLIACWASQRVRKAHDKSAQYSARCLLIACAFTTRLGAPLADILDLINRCLDDAQEVEEARQAASAGPLLSARVLSALPLIGIVAAFALGANPLTFLLGGGVGSVCALVGVSLWGVGIGVCRRIVVRARGEEEEIDGALACDLVGAALVSGVAIPSALEGLGEALDDDTLRVVGACLRLGMDWDEAWAQCPLWASGLREGLRSGWEMGASPVVLLSRCAQWERRERKLQARVRAEEMGVRLVGPLGLFFLPAFVCLGIVPVLAYLLSGMTAL